ncbi:DNA polymerase III beta subunit [Pseudomonas phage vB_PaeM_USP_18]|nr:DNA polymerase III beta subunit [Pseudomonas phage vB_PaeM_USP_18]QLI49488.1 DNA polymerase III beta subunit [Pseudomonas phage vB_PaeM_USP_25]
MGIEYIARVNPKYFAAIELFAAEKDVRYYLNGVRIEPHPQQGAILVATNGHRLAVIHDPDGWCKEPIIVGDIPRALVAACKVKGSFLKLTEPKQLWISKGGAVLMGLGDTEPPTDPFNAGALHINKIAIVDGKFPDWRRVMPTERADSLVRFPAVNPKYLAEIHTAASILEPNQKKWGGAVRLEAKDEQSVIVARILGIDLLERFVLVIMPLREMASPKTIVPAFAMAPAQETKPKAKPRIRQNEQGEWSRVEEEAHA